MKKVLGSNMMPEEHAGFFKQYTLKVTETFFFSYTGEYKSLESLSPSQLQNSFQREIFTLAGDSGDGTLQCDSGKGEYLLSVLVTYVLCLVKVILSTTMRTL